MTSNNWQKFKIDDICDLGRGRVISKNEIRNNPGDYPVYSSQTTSNGEMGRLGSHDFDGEYVTWTTDGAYAGTVFYRKGKFNCTNVCGTLSAKDVCQLNMRFLAYFLSTKTERHVVKTGNPKLMNNIMANIEVLIPPISEQNKIGEILSTIDEMIQKTDQIVQKTENLESDLKDQLLAKGLDINATKMPVVWTIGGIIDVVKSDDKNAIKPGPFGSSLKKNIFTQSGYKIYGQEQVISGNHKIGNYYIDAAKYKQMKGFSIKSGDVLISLVGTIGQVLIVGDDWEPGIINPRLIKISPDQNKMRSKYLAYLLSSNIIKTQLDKISHGGTMSVLNGKNLRSLRFGIPIMEEQDKIVSILESLKEKILKYKCVKEKYKILKTGLMNDIFSQKIQI